MSLDGKAEQLKALGDPTRLRILRLLPMLQQAPSEQDPDCKGVYNVSELGEELGIPQPTVSHHLKVLYQAGLLKNQKMCRDVYYWVDEAIFGELLRVVKETAETRDESS